MEISTYRLPEQSPSSSVIDCISTYNLPVVMSEEIYMTPDHKNLLKGYNMLLYFAGSMIMYEPTEECVIDFLTEGILKKLPVSSSNPRFMLAAAYLRDSCIDRIVCRETLIADYNRLFSSDGLKLALPLSSAYAEFSPVKESGGNVSEFYESYGWKSRPAVNVPDDHLGIKLLFLTKLIDKYLQLDDDPCCREMQNEIRRFLSRHILTWLPEWNGRIQNHSNTFVYKGIGNLIHACAEDLNELFDHCFKPL